MGGGSTRGARVPTPKRLDVGRVLICRKITKGKSSVLTVERGPTPRERPKRRHEKGQEGDPRETPLTSRNHWLRKEPGEGWLATTRKASE